MYKLFNKQNKVHSQGRHSFLLNILYTMQEKVFEVKVWTVKQAKQGS